jgi:hypothetical protein
MAASEQIHPLLILIIGCVNNKQYFLYGRWLKLMPEEDIARSPVGKKQLEKTEN